MSDADIKANIGVSTDVEQATRKTNTAIVSMAKQLEDVQKKFSTAGKDIFLGLFAPMAIFQTVMGFISDGIAKAKQDAKDGLELISQGESKYASAEEARAAAFFKRKKEIDDEKKLVTAGREEITKQILENQGGQFRDFELPSKYVQQLKAGSTTLAGLSSDKEVQRLAMEYFSKTDAGKRILDSMGEGFKTKADNFKGPEGFSNVVGVGANPVIEAMNAQLEEAQKQTALLEKIANPDGGVPSDFTKTTK